jgi:hypothetical protein
MVLKWFPNVFGMVSEWFRNGLLRNGADRGEGGGGTTLTIIQHGFGMVSTWFRHGLLRNGADRGQGGGTANTIISKY